MNTAMLFDHTSTSLTAPEQEQLSILEQTIERGLKTFVDVGTALMVVRDSKLFRQDFETFEDYCRKRWSMGKSQVYRMIDAAGVVENLRKSPIGDFPATESQARPLAKLDPDQQREAWAKSVETAPNGKVTAAHVQSVVDQYEEPEVENEWNAGAVSLNRDWTEEELDDYAEAVNVVVPAVTPDAMAVHYSSKTDLWSTPQALYDTLNREFGFNLDVCASAENAKCVRYYTEEQDGLAQEWSTSTCWMNPPYGDDIPKWIAKAHASAVAGAIVVCLVPARTDTGWWWDYCIEGEIRFLRGRLKFGDGKGSAPFPSAVVIFRTFALPAHKKVVWWDYHV